MPKSNRAWVFTHPGHDEEVIARLRDLESERMVVGREVGESGYKHLQGYVRFREPVRLSWWKNQFPKAHVEVRGWVKGVKIASTEANAAEYCMKGGDVVIDVGVNFDEKLELKGISKDEEALQVIKEIETGARYGQIRSRHKLFFFWNRRNIIDYIRDERWIADYPDQDPTA